MFGRFSGAFPRRSKNIKGFLCMCFTKLVVTNKEGAGRPTVRIEKVIKYII